MDRLREWCARIAELLNRVVAEQHAAVAVITASPTCTALMLYGSAESEALHRAPFNDTRCRDPGPMRRDAGEPQGANLPGGSERSKEATIDV